MKDRNKWWATKPKVPEPTTITRDGFPAYILPIEEAIIQTLMTGAPINRFYVGQEEAVQEMIDVLDKATPVFLARAICYAREEGFTRAAPILGLVMLSKKSPVLFHQIAQHICKNPKDWETFIDICRSRSVRPGMGRGIKRELLKAIANMSEYHAMKYPGAVKDMIRTARPKADLNRTTIEYIMENHPPEGKISKLWALEHVKKKELPPNAIANMIRNEQLPYEVVTSLIGTNAEAWKALMDIAPHFNLLRNLNTFYEHGCLLDRATQSEIAMRVVDRVLIEHAKLFPFRYYAAWKNLDIALRNTPIEDALKAALELSVLNVPFLKGVTCIATDVSGSMIANVTDKESVLQCLDVAAVFTGIMINRCEQSLPLPFDGQVRADIIRKIMAVESKKIMDYANCFEHPGGSTALGAPLEVLYQNKIVVDRYIAFTDDEQNTQTKWLMSGFVDMFLRYRKEIAPNCKAYLVTLIPAPSVPIPPSIEGVYFIHGWSDNVLKYIASDAGTQLEAVRNYPLPG